MDAIFNLADFLEPVNPHQISEDEGYLNGQIGKSITVYHEELPDIEEYPVVLLGCAETRGAGYKTADNDSPNAVRKAFYKLFYWHTEIKIADLGNVKTGATLNDSYAALRTVTHELINAGKTVIIIGGTHDLSLAQYQCYSLDKKYIDAVCVDSRIDLNIDSVLRADNFLMEMLTTEPNYLKHYNHIAFQSYFVHPHMLETMDKLRFDCFRVGRVKEDIEEMEPVIRNSSMISFDIAAIANAFAPANRVSPNGLNGEEACTLMKYAGLSSFVNTLGIYGYDTKQDIGELTALQIAQMIWYFIDGRYKSLTEARLSDREYFNEFHLAFTEVETTFLQSKKTGRWWMKLPDETFIPCSYNDYLIARNNDIPERWLRAQERS
ncbi:MAG TPA: formimidoylglutamase [Parasegetibacter sp.]